MTALHSTPSRIVAVAIGIPVLLAGMGQGAISIVGTLARTSEKHSVSYPWSGGTLALNTEDGDVTVRRSTAVSTIGVSYTEHYGLVKPKVSGVLTASGLDLSSSCSAWYASNCSVNYTVLVPPGVSLTLNTGDGTVSLDGVDGAVTVHAGDGRIRGTDLRSTEVSARAGDGSVSLQWAVAPEHVDVSIGDGSLKLAVPTGSGPYAIDKRQGDGSTSVTVGQDSAANRTMRLRMGDGSLSVH